MLIRLHALLFIKIFPHGRKFLEYYYAAEYGTITDVLENFIYYIQQKP